jgi:PPOX class probable F420-dependent enzyme
LVYGQNWNSVEDNEIWRRAASEPVAHMASSGPDGKPHIVPITFAFEGKVLYFAVDAKPKRTTNLQRLRNIAANPAVSILVDHYDDNWEKLWWVRLDGDARILGERDEIERALDLLAARYRQYTTNRPSGPVVAVTIRRTSAWSAAEAQP